MAVLALLIPGLAAPQTVETPKRYECRRAVRPIVVDGKLDDPAWGVAAWTDDFVDIAGPGKPAPRFRTRAKMLWDERYLYIAAEMEEPDILGTLTKHDSVIFKDNDFEVFLKPPGDGKSYFEFEINALNTSWDLYLDKPYKDGGKADNSWDMPGLRTAIGIDGTLNNPKDRDKGWNVEIAIPWNSFHSRLAVSKPFAGAEWRINFSRVEWHYEVVNGKYIKAANRSEDNWVWSPQYLVNMHVPERWGFLRLAQ